MHLVNWILFVVKLLHIGISAEVSLFDFPWVEQLLLIAFVYRLHIEQQVGILYRGEDETEETDGDTSALRMGVIVDIGGGIEEVAMSFQLVVFLVGLQYLWDDNGCVGFCKRIAEVMDEVVDGIALISVVVLQALHHVVIHLPDHFLLGGGRHKDEQQDNKDDAADKDDASALAAKQSLDEVLLTLSVIDSSFSAFDIKHSGIQV
jgi:hypothetical protein